MIITTGRLQLVANPGASLKYFSNAFEKVYLNTHHDDLLFNHSRRSRKQVVYCRPSVSFQCIQHIIFYTLNFLFGESN